MPFPRPTLQELVTRGSEDVSSSMLGSGAILQRSVLMILVRVFAGLVHTLYDNIGYAFRQTIPDSATDEYLDRFAAIWGVPRLPAAPAVGSITITGVDTTLIPAGTQFGRSDGETYTTDANVTITGGSVLAAVTCENSGTGGNADPATILTLTSPIVGADNDAAVDSGGLVGGADTESDDSLRSRMLNAIRFASQGGSVQDYIDWVRLESDIDQVFIYPAGYGLGTVKIQFTILSGTEIPNAAKILAVQTSIDALRPATSVSIVAEVFPYTLNTNITITPNDSGTQQSVAAEIEDSIKRAREPGKLITAVDIQNAAIRGGATTAVVNSPLVSDDPGTDGIVNVVNVVFA